MLLSIPLVPGRGNMKLSAIFSGLLKIAVTLELRVGDDVRMLKHFHGSAERDKEIDCLSLSERNGQSSGSV